MKRCRPFVLVACEHGTMILNRNDHRTVPTPDGKTATYGVGYSLLIHGEYQGEEVKLLVELARHRRKHHGDGVYVLDVGANIGGLTVPIARQIMGWGYVVAIEAQEWPYYALAGNLAINNLGNARALHIAAGSYDGSIKVPVLNPTMPASFGGLSIRGAAAYHDVGQTPDFENAVDTDIRRIDSLNLSRVDIMKIDVEGMELEVLLGAAEVIERDHPVIFVEYIKTDDAALLKALKRHGYDKFTVADMNLLFIHPDDPTTGIFKET